MMAKESCNALLDEFTGVAGLAESGRKIHHPRRKVRALSWWVHRAFSGSRIDNDYCTHVPTT